jgi:hypothetical protein
MCVEIGRRLFYLEKVMAQLADEMCGYASERGCNCTFEESVIIL